MALGQRSTHVLAGVVEGIDAPVRPEQGDLPSARVDHEGAGVGNVGESSDRVRRHEGSLILSACVHLRSTPSPASWPTSSFPIRCWSTPPEPPSPRTTRHPLENALNA